MYRHISIHKYTHTQTHTQAFTNTQSHTQAFTNTHTLTLTESLGLVNLCCL